MKIYLAFILLLSTVFSSYAQEKSNSLSYPDLIPILENGLYGYCDKDKKVIIEPQFKWATFFEEDLDFHDIKNPKNKIFGSNAYATVWQDGQRMRIDKKGNVVYRYNPDDFNEIRPKESINASIKQSYEKFQDDRTLLWGVRDIATGEVLIPTRYPIIVEELYSYFHVPQYPLILVSPASGEKKFYVGLNGNEYRETVAAQSQNEGYKIDYRGHLSGSDSATAELRNLSQGIQD